MEKSIPVYNKNTAVKIINKYSSGQRKFHGVQLQKADLREEILSQIDLQEADLSYANLKNTDLSNADLRKSCLIRAELSGANLSRANLTSADLSRANLAIAKLVEANLTRACLNKACLTAAQLVKVDLSYANLTGTYLIGFDLSQVNLKGAFYDRDTTFPPDFDPVKRGMLQGYDFEKLLAQFNHLCKCSNRYLGSTMTIKYFYSSRPEFEWLKQFEINKSNQITFQGISTNSVSPIQLIWFQKWINNFIQSCSQIIKDFSKIVQI